MDMKKNLVVGSSIALLLLIAFGAWWMLHQNRQVARVKELSSKMFENREGMSREDRDQAFRQLREARESLSESQRSKLGDDMRAQMMERMQERMESYFAKPPKERMAYLDEQIRRDQSRRREREKARREREANGETRDRGERAGRGGGPPWTGGRGGRPGIGDNEQRMERRRGMLDATSPLFRAQMAEYREDMRQRREQLGLEGDGGRGRGRF